MSRVGPRFLMRQRFHLTLPEVVRADISRNLVHPAAEVAVFPECVSIFQHPHEDFLSKVLARRSVGRHSKEKSE